MPIFVSYSKECSNSGQLLIQRLDEDENNDA